MCKAVWLVVASALMCGLGCGPSLTDLCRDECDKLNACEALLGQGSGVKPSNCSAQCQDFGVSITSSSACPDIGGADDCVKAVAPTGQGDQAANACVTQVDSCLQQHCGSPQ